MPAEDRAGLDTKVNMRRRNLIRTRGFRPYGAWTMIAFQMRIVGARYRIKKRAPYASASLMEGARGRFQAQSPA